MEAPSTTYSCALVTGGAVRIGRAICESFAEAGLNVVIHYRRSGEEARSLRDDLRARGVKAACIEADLSGRDACRALLGEAKQALQAPDVLVNNASVFNQQRFPEFSEEDLLAEFRPNLFAPLFLMQAFAEEADTGCIINLLDRRVSSHDTRCVPYLLSKKALHEATLLAARAYAPGIRVNAVSPGAILPPPGESDDYLKKADPALLDQRCTPADIAAAALSLLQQPAVTGQVITVDAGQSLAQEPIR